MPCFTALTEARRGDKGGASANRVTSVTPQPVAQLEQPAQTPIAQVQALHQLAQYQPTFTWAQTPQGPHEVGAMAQVYALHQEWQ